MPAAQPVQQRGRASRATLFVQGKADAHLGCGPERHWDHWWHQHACWCSRQPITSVLRPPCNPLRCPSFIRCTSTGCTRSSFAVKCAARDPCATGGCASLRTGALGEAVAAAVGVTAQGPAKAATPHQCSLLQAATSCRMPRHRQPATSGQRASPLLPPPTHHVFSRKAGRAACSDAGAINFSRHDGCAAGHRCRAAGWRVDSAAPYDGGRARGRRGRSWGLG